LHVYCSIGTIRSMRRARCRDGRAGRALAPSQGGHDREAGLDYHYDSSPREAGRACAIRTPPRGATALPLVIHSRDADADMAQILEETGKGAFPADMHCLPAAAILRSARLRSGCSSRSRHADLQEVG
jgi:hypothetical protein